MLVTDPRATDRRSLPRFEPSGVYAGGVLGQQSWSDARELMGAAFTFASGSVRISEPDRESEGDRRRAGTRTRARRAQRLPAGVSLLQPRPCRARTRRDLNSNASVELFSRPESVFDLDNSHGATIVDFTTAPAHVD